MGTITMPLDAAQCIIESVAEEELIDPQSPHNNQRTTGTVAQTGPVIFIDIHLGCNISLEAPDLLFSSLLSR